MVIRGKWQDRPVAINLKTGHLAISIGEPESAQVTSYDLAGRLWSAYRDSRTYRRGLNGRIMVKWRNSDNVRQREWLIDEDARQLEKMVHQEINEFYQAVKNGLVDFSTPLPQQGLAILEQAAAFDRERSGQDIVKFRQIYQPVGILPPDHYLAVVLQAAEGCSFNTCNFCSFYKSRPFRIKSVDEFEQHARAVKDYLGEGLSLRQSIFIGDANALVIPMPKLVPLLEVIHRVYEVAAMGGLYAFLDGFSGEKKSAADYARLAGLGIKRIYVGLESGSDELLKFLGKPGKVKDAIQAVQAMKTGGIGVGVIILTGAGGKQYAEDHIRQTQETLNLMQLGKGDILYFSELVMSEDLSYAQEVHRAGIEPLIHQECMDQETAIRKGLVFDDKPVISRYDIREFVY